MKRRRTIIAVSTVFLVLLTVVAVYSQGPYTLNPLQQPKFTGTVVGRYNLQQLNYSLGVGNIGPSNLQASSVLRIDTQTGKTSVLVKRNLNPQGTYDFEWMQVNETPGSQLPEN